jgi:arabinogalactan endo-1,4-beta-galactosidase
MKTHSKLSMSNLKKITVFSFIIAALAACSPQPKQFCIGADVSHIPRTESRDAVYTDLSGQGKDPLVIMQENGFNNIRLRIFVDPTAENGYSKEGFCGLEETVKLGKRIIDAKMNFALDFHYSDYWADPDKQFKPESWKGLTGKELCDALYDYTKMVLTTLKEAGAAPVIIQIGNEINHGMVWPEGKIDDNSTEENWKALMELYVAGQKATREVLPDSKLMVHLALGGENTLCREFLDYMNKYGAEFDIIGVSYYERWHETYNDLKSNIYDLTARYNKPVCVCEYGANADNIRIINDIVRSVPNGLGFGTMAWEPMRVLFPDNKLSAEIAGIYNNIKTDYADPKYKSTVEPPFEREAKFDEFAIGADVSWVQKQEDDGIKFKESGVEKDVFKILSNNKFNWIRLRLFVNPEAENGYSKEGYCDLENTIKIAKRIKSAGMKFLLDFHYSDNWADPGKQFTPSAWARFNGSGLEGQIYNYSNETIKKFISEGVTPDMVQIGNEINHGMVWPQGKIEDSYMPFIVLLRCASAGVRAADPNIKIMVHIACGGQNEESVKFFDKILSRDVKFDVIGQSYYPRWHGTLDDLKANLTDMVTRYKKPVIVVEYQEHRKEVNEIVHSLPDSMGVGTFIWEATSPHWGNLFDKDGNTVDDNMAVYPAFYKSIN